MFCILIWNSNGVVFITMFVSTFRCTVNKLTSFGFSTSLDNSAINGSVLSSTMSRCVVLLASETFNNFRFRILSVIETAGNK